MGEQPGIQHENDGILRSAPGSLISALSADQRLLAQGKCRATAAASSGHSRSRLARCKVSKRPEASKFANFIFYSEPWKRRRSRRIFTIAYYSLVRQCVKYTANTLDCPGNATWNPASGLLILIRPMRRAACYLRGPVFSPPPCHPPCSPGLFLDDDEWRLVFLAIPNPWIL